MHVLSAPLTAMSLGLLALIELLQEAKDHVDRLATYVEGA